MSLIAVAVKHLLAAGVTGDAIVTAIAEMEAVQTPAVSAGAVRMRRLRQRKANEASQSVTRDGCDAPFLPSEVSPHTPLPTNQPIQVPPYSPPKARRAKQPETLDADGERVAEQVWAAASQTARDRSSRKENRKAVAAALGQGATAESLTASVRRLCEAKGEFANGVHILVSGEHWRDEQAPARADEPDPWPHRLTVWNRDRHWRETWGPPPGRPGYRGPEPQPAAA